MRQFSSGFIFSIESGAAFVALSLLMGILDNTMGVERSANFAGIRGKLLDYQNAQKVPNGCQFRLTLFLRVVGISVHVFGRVVHF